MPEAPKKNSPPSAARLDPAATDATNENAREGAKKRRAPNEPAAVVGFGASAGGLTPLQQFFGEMPADSGLAFVVVMHLSPEHESNLAAIIQQKTSMPVTQVNGPLEVRANQVYVIPPNNQLMFEDGHLRLLGDGGEMQAVGGVTHDITERRKADLALRESEERFRQFAENSADVFWIVNAETQQLEYVNPVYEKMWGEPREAALGTVGHWLKLVHPDDRDLARSLMPKVLAGESFVVEYRIIRPCDNALRWIRDTGFPIRNEKGDVYRAAGVAQDVTADKLRSEALAESEERFRLLIDGAPDYAMFLLDPGNQIIYWSSGAERVFGWSADEALGQSGELIFTPEDRAREQEEKEMRTALRKGVAPDQRWQLRKDGSRVWVDGVMRRLDDENGNLRAFAKIARDATELHRAEEELKASHENLERGVRERTAELTALNEKLQTEINERAKLEQEILLVSEREKRRIGQDLHDSLCQELAAAALFLRSAAHKTEKKNPAGAKLLEDASRIVNDNVGLARDLARGLHPVELTSSGLANALRELAFRTSQLRSVTCRFDCPRQVRSRDEAVALNLYRIAQEAVTNAIKNGKATTITIKLARNRGKLSLSVKDNGKGFSTTTTSFGMGLHIMKYRADVIGAQFTLESAEGQGTLVTCVIPGG